MNNKEIYAHIYIVYVELRIWLYALMQKNLHIDCVMCSWLIFELHCILKKCTGKNCFYLFSSNFFRWKIFLRDLLFWFLFRYKNYEFVSDQEISKSAGLGSRYSDSSLHGVLFDIQMLSECDYLVCTFSSQVKHCCCCHGNSNYAVDTSWKGHMPRVESSFIEETSPVVPYWLCHSLMLSNLKIPWELSENSQGPQFKTFYLLPSNLVV